MAICFQKFRSCCTHGSVSVTGAGPLPGSCDTLTRKENKPDDTSECVPVFEWAHCVLFGERELRHDEARPRSDCTGSKTGQSDPGSCECVAKGGRCESASDWGIRS